MEIPGRVMERATEKVALSSSGCWISDYAPGTHGYAVIGWRGEDGKSRAALVHRVTWQAVNGPVPEGMTLDHLCRVRRCVNPDHLEPVSQMENNRRYTDSIYSVEPKACKCVVRHLHGTAAMVRNHRCKCDECVRAPGLIPVGPLRGRPKR